ncbi:YciI family protein [Actinocrispum sp. NPDC049592]|uniref:YciI family protein n=1 Tax=Actinocrispum sp. NPDC049592 TaxID=3154835 RepID=UPI003425CB82
MLLMTTNVKAWEEMDQVWSPEDIKAMIEFMGRLNDELVASGEFVDAQGLTHPNDAKIVLAQKDGDPVVTDGPFPEAKEFLAGYWVLDVADEARALEIAARISSGDGTFPVCTQIVVQPVGRVPEA